MNHLKLTHEVLDVKKICDIGSAESCGATSMFIGTTRDNFEGFKVISLEYEAYQPMAMKQLERICKKLRNEWKDIANIAIYHRLGLVPVGEASVVIAISSPHRETSLKAVAVAIDDLKKNVPIWKKEVFRDKKAIWKENKESGVHYRDEDDVFDERMCLVEDALTLNSQFVQISVPENEIKRRIQCFVEKKRNEIDLCNIMDYTDGKWKENLQEENKAQEENESDTKSMTCARVNSTIIKQEFSKCHLKVSRVMNNIGPQTRPNYLNTLDKLMVPTGRDNAESRFSAHKKRRLTHSTSEEQNMLKFSTALDRLESIEQHLNIPQSHITNIYQRLKLIEDRLIFLESISPEYAHFLVEKFEVKNADVRDIKPNRILQYERKKYSVNEIDAIVQSFEQRNLDYQDSNIMT